MAAAKKKVAAARVDRAPPRARARRPRRTVWWPPTAVPGTTTRSSTPWSAGIVLQGSEVKSLRAGRIALQDAYARIIDGEMWLFGVHIPPYAQANGFGAHEPDRRRKLLLHRRQIDEWMGRAQQQSLTLVPLSIYFKDGRAKVELALARGRRQYDKRHAIATRDANREAAREARAATRARPR